MSISLLFSKYQLLVLWIFSIVFHYWFLNYFFITFHDHLNYFLPSVSFGFSLLLFFF